MPPLPPSAEPNPSPPMSPLFLRPKCLLLLSALLLLRQKLFGPEKVILLPNSSVNLVLHSRAVRNVLVSFSLAMCSEISNHTTLLTWLPTGVWQLAQVSLREEASLPLLQELVPSLLLSLIFTLCLSSFHALLHSPLVFILLHSSSLTSLPLLLLNPPSLSLLGAEVRLMELLELLTGEVL